MPEDVESFNMVVTINVSDKGYGGHLYEDEVVNSVKEVIEIKREYVKAHKYNVLNLIHFCRLYIKYKFFFDGTLLLSNGTTYFTGFRSRNIVIVHHIDSHFSFKFMKLYEFLCDRYLFRHPKRYDTVVAVSDFWKEEFKSKGLRNVKVIYNSFNPEDFRFSQESKDAFRKKYNLYGKPLIYLGNGRKGKGAEESYEALKEIDVNFVTSGQSDISLPVPNLFLSGEEYRLLLASSDVVLTMSTFKEGWNRTAHEASLCGTPVIGSGMAGMKELLDLAGQTVVTDFSELLDAVTRAINIEYQPTERILSLNIQYFRNRWLDVLK